MKRFLALALLLAWAVGTAQAGSIGTQGFADIGTPTVDTGNINTANTFNIGDLISTSANTGVFTGLPTQIFGPESFTASFPTSFSFGSSVFGTFSSISIEEFNSTTPGSASFYILGNYTGGTFDPGASGLASFTISFTQTPAGTGSISDSATLSIPPAPAPGVPEPATLIMGLTAIVGGAFFHIVRCRRTGRAAA